MSVAIDLSGKVAIVTGAASGIGAASAKLFADAGASVACFDKAEAVEETAVAIRDAGGKAFAMSGDAGEDADIAQLVERTCAEFGGVDIFFANAGISHAKRDLAERFTGSNYWQTDVEEWAEVLRVNVIGPSLAVKHAAPKIKARGGGAIICTASVAGLRSGAGPAPYSASKAGVINLVMTAAQQLRGTGVRVNAICPGLIETGMTKFAYDAARAAGKEDKIGTLNPLRRGGEPREIAGAALFLASELGSYVNGHALVVDGGLSTSHPITSREMSIEADI